jgi:hypothetical protein
MNTMPNFQLANREKVTQLELILTNQSSVSATTAPADILIWAALNAMYDLPARVKVVVASIMQPTAEYRCQPSGT